MMIIKLLRYLIIEKFLTFSIFLKVVGKKLKVFFFLTKNLIVNKINYISINENELIVIKNELKLLYLFFNT